MDEHPDMLNLIARSLALVISTLLVGVFLVKKPAEVFWNIEPDHVVTLGWLLSGLVLFPGTVLTVILGYVACMRCRSLIELDRRMRESE